MTYSAFSVASAGGVGGLLNVQYFTSGSGTYTATPGTVSIVVEIIGGGGGGGGAAISSGAYAAAGSGAAGSYCRKYIAAASPTYSYGVGAGGAGAVAGNNAGSVGGDTTFGSLTAFGGGYGGGSASIAAGAIGGTGGSASIATGGDINTTGAPGTYGIATSTEAVAGFGGSSFFGGGAFANAASGTTGVAGANATANTGGGGSGAVAANNAAAFAGGAGGSGIIVVYEFGPTSSSTASANGSNRVVNGDFQVWQRGAGGSAVIAVPATSTLYAADRWQVSNNASQALTISQIAGATSGTYLAKVQRNAGQTGTINFSFLTSLTRSMCAGFAGVPITLSFKAKKGADYSATSNALVVRIATGTGSADISLLNGFTGQVNTDTTITLTNTLTTYTVTITAGASVTQAGIDFICTPTGIAGTDDSFYIADVQLDPSVTATPFQRLNFQQQLENCLPFYQKSGDYVTEPYTSGSGSSIQIACSASSAVNNAYYAFVQFSTPMFQNPVMVTFPYTTATNTNIWSNGNGNDYPANSAVPGIQGSKFFSIQNQSGGTLTITANQLVVGGWTADADLV